MATQTLSDANATVNAGYYAATTLNAVDTDLVSTNIKSSVDIFGTVGTFTSDGDAVAGDMRTGKKAYVNGALVTGTVAAGAANVDGANGVNPVAIPAGIYAGTETATANDADLTAANIKSGVNIFGVAGTASLTSQSVVPITGQTSTVPLDPAPEGSDGNLHKGVAYPNPRFTAHTDNNGDGDCVDDGETCNGTVTDNLTGLIWLKNANCFGSRSWANALTDCGGLANGSCGLTDGSTAGNWRLPNIKELQSLIDFAYSGPALSANPFTSVELNNYWTSTTLANSNTISTNTRSAVVISLSSGAVSSATKTLTRYVWPVRGPQ
ncbi:MAG: DUF1566 domain-containing protein [Desulfamplus sp.]|nr:DUF1566 domain-containing protein [Desulfamplus sp.]